LNSQEKGSVVFIVTGLEKSLNSSLTFGLAAVSHFAFPEPLLACFS